MYILSDTCIVSCVIPFVRFNNIIICINSDFEFTVRIMAPRWDWKVKVLSIAWGDHSQGRSWHRNASVLKKVNFSSSVMSNHRQRERSHKARCNTKYRMVIDQVSQATCIDHLIHSEK